MKMDPSIVEALAAVGGVLISLIVAVWTIINIMSSHLNRIQETAAKEVSAAKEKADRDIQAARAEADRDISLVRADLDGRINSELSSLSNAMDKRMSELSVAEDRMRTEMSARLQLAVGRIEQSVQHIERTYVAKEDFNRLSNKMDTVSDKVVAVGTQVDNIHDTLQKILTVTTKNSG